VAPLALFQAASIPQGALGTTIGIDGSIGESGLLGNILGALVIVSIGTGTVETVINATTIGYSIAGVNYHKDFVPD
jgi:hypothetical protein